MTKVITLSASLILLAMFTYASAQDVPDDVEERATQSVDDIEEQAKQVVDEAQETMDQLAETIDRSEQANEVSAGILKPIYQLAEAFSFPAFHWFAFAVMVAGVISFGLQLVLGKLVVLSQLGFSMTEILSDALGLVVSLIGLVLTTQAATENSNFTASAAAVISATAVGAVFGFIFYLWGQRHELQAVEGRRKAAGRVESRGSRV